MVKMEVEKSRILSCKQSKHDTGTAKTFPGSCIGGLYTHDLYRRACGTDTVHSTHRYTIMVAAQVSSAVLKHNREVVLTSYRSLLRATYIAFKGKCLDMTQTCT